MHAPYCTGHSVCALSFLCEWLAAEKLRWEEKENTLRGSQATITTGTTSICTHTEDMDDTTERESEKKKHPFQTNITAIWAKIWSKHVLPFRTRENNNGPKATLLFATVVVNVQAKSSREHGVQLLFWASEQLGALAYGRGSTVTALLVMQKSRFPFLSPGQ